MATKSRWKILSKALKEKTVSDEYTTKRSFQSYNILMTEKLDEDDLGCWHTVSLPHSHRNKKKSNIEAIVNNEPLISDIENRTETPRDKRTLESDIENGCEPNQSENLERPSSRSRNETVSVLIRLLKPSVNITQLMGFNNTGNVCVWPSEECLALYLATLYQPGSFTGRVLEVGGGQTCLAGLIFASLHPQSRVVLTDGNEDSVANLKEICARNSELSVESGLYRWTQETNAEVSPEQYDIILCADCLFFDEGREQLITSMNQLTKKGGKVFVMAPERAGTMRKFVSLAEEYFSIEMKEDYDPEVTRKHKALLSDPTYDPDIHFPKLVIMTKTST